MLVHNLATQFGTLAETVELLLALAMMIAGVVITWLIQKWADKTSAEQPSAANLGQANLDPYEDNSMRD